MSYEQQPETRKQMLEAGWKFNGSNKCTLCQAPIDWWILPDGLRTLAFNPTIDEDDPAIAHVTKCPRRPEHMAGEVGRAASLIQQQLGARAVIIVTDEACAVCHRQDVGLLQMRSDTFKVVDRYISAQKKNGVPR